MLNNKELQLTKKWKIVTPRVAIFNRKTGGRVSFGDGVNYSRLYSMGILVDFINWGDLSFNKLREYDCLFLDDVRSLKASHCKTLERYVKNGGGIIATSATAVPFQKGIRRNRKQVARLFDVEIGQEEGPRQNKPWRIKFTSFDAYLNVIGPASILSKGRSSEVCAIWKSDTEQPHPAIVMNTFGEGRTVYCAASFFPMVNPSDGKLKGISGPESVLRSFYVRALKWILNTELYVSLNPWPHGHTSCFILTFDAEIDRKTSKREYEIAFSKLLKLLDGYQLKATFNCQGLFAKEFPQIIRALNKQCSEIAGHSYAHISLDKLSPLEQMKDISENVSILAASTQEPICGFRCPEGKWNIETMRVLDQLNFLWDSSHVSDFKQLGIRFPYRILSSYSQSDPPLRNDIVPILPPRTARGQLQLIEIPFHFPDDWYTYEVLMESPKEYEKITGSAFMKSCREKSLFVLLVHPHLLTRDRIDVLESLLNKIMKLKPWICTCKELARWHNARNSLVVKGGILKSNENYLRLRFLVENRNSDEIRGIVLKIHVMGAVGHIYPSKHKVEYDMNDVTLTIPEIQGHGRCEIDLSYNLRK